MRVLVLDLSGTVDASLLETSSSLVTVELSRVAAFDVMSGRDIREMAALEADRVEAGCTTDTSCLAEVAGALGARFVVYGTVAELGQLTVVTLHLFDADQGLAVSREIVEAESKERLPHRLRVGVQNLVAGALGRPRVDQPSPSASAPAPARVEGDLTLRDVVVITGRIVVTAGAVVGVLGALGYLGGYLGAVAGTWVASDQPVADVLWVLIPVAGPLINLGRRGAQYDASEIVALVAASVFQTCGILLCFTGITALAAGATLIGFDETVASVVDDGTPTNGGAPAGATAMVY
jgi:hypothetical protein